MRTCLKILMGYFLISIPSLFATEMSDILTEAIVNYNSPLDYQVYNFTLTRLWSVFEEPIKGVYATMWFNNPPGVSGKQLVWNFFDVITQAWVKKPDTPYLAPVYSGTGNIEVNYYSTYKYYPFFTAMSTTTIVWWPAPPFDPRNFNGQYMQYPGQEWGEAFPIGGLTKNGYHHIIFTDYDGHMSGVQYAIMYNRFPVDAPIWEGYVPLVLDEVGPWYAFYADPFTETIVTIYWKITLNYHIIALIDTLEGEMYYAGFPIQKDVTQFIINKFNLPPDWMGSGFNPFVDKNGNVHLMTFLLPPDQPDTGRYEVYVYHWFYDVHADTMGASFIKHVPPPQYSQGINPPGGQMGQGRGSGILYAIWEEPHPTKGVVSSNGYWRAATQIVLGISKDNGKTWTEEVLLLSTNVPGQNDTNNWLKFPVISPIIGHSGNLDLVYWGVYFDDDPGFYWRGIGGLSTVKMLVGRKEVGVEEISPISYDKTRIKYDGTDIIFEIPYKSYVILKLIDVSGREKGILYKGNMQGKHVLKLERKISSGVCFINLKTEKENLISKIIVK